MIRWCSYCERYIDEIAPLDDYRITHGICGRCDGEKQWSVHTRAESALLHASMYARIRSAVQSGSIDATRDALDAAIAHGLEPVDLAIGMLQPILREIGNLWATGRVSVAMEHASTYAVTEMLDHIYAPRRDYDLLRSEVAPEILLAPAPGNDHVLGVQVMGLFLHARGIRCHVTTQRHSPQSLADVARASNPRILGLSIAMPEQLEGIDATCRALIGANAAPRPRVIVGGFPLRQGLVPPPDTPYVTACTADAVIALLREAPPA